MVFFPNKKKELTHKLLYEMYYNTVYKTAFYITKSHESAQDILQETFIKAFKNLEKLDDHDKIKSWLVKITTRTAIDHFRKNDKVALHELNDELTQGSFPLPDEAFETKWRNNIIWRSINSLDYETNSILILKYVHGFKDEEISKHLNISVGTIKSRVHRAKNKLKSELMVHLDVEGERRLGRGTT